MDTKNQIPANEVNNVDKYPGIAVNIADHEKDTEKLVKDRTKALNNNPRNSAC